MTSLTLLRFAGCSAMALAMTACGGADPDVATQTSVIETASIDDPTTGLASDQPEKVEPTSVSAETPSSIESDMAAMLKRGRIVWFKCRACHETDVGKRHKVGPNLHDLFDTPAAAKADFSYSAALSESGIVWTDETLDAFITKPASYVEGTKMAFVGISKDSDRKALIEYLRQETAPKP